MIEFQTVTKEIRSLISRRQDLITFLGSVFAALGIVLQNTLQGSLPPPLASIEGHIFCAYAVMLMVPSLILALRMARLHGGMVLNGMLYARLMQHQDFTRPGDPERAARHNFLGVSFLQFLLTDFLAGFSATVLALTLAAPLRVALAAGAGVFLAWLGMYFRFHRRCVRVARRKIVAEACAPFDRSDWEAHLSASLEDANHGLIADIGFVGLMIFSVFEVMSGLGQVHTNQQPDLRVEHIRLYGPLAYTVLMLVTCGVGLITYLRVRVAIGTFSLALDPTDRPFRPLTLTDSLLGYLLLAFLLAVSVHLFLIQVMPALGTWKVLGIDLATLALAVLLEQATLVAAGRYFGRKPDTTRGRGDALWEELPSGPLGPPPQPAPHVEPAESRFPPEGQSHPDRPRQASPEPFPAGEALVGSSSMTTDRIVQIAHRHGFSAEAARTLWGALQASGGGLAQFDHPELGGRGQWMPGMIMIGAMFDTALKARVAALCTDLAALVKEGNPPASSQAQAQAPPGGHGGESRNLIEPMRPMEPMRGIAPWWPEELGQPSSAGGQDDLRYAYFAGRRRLVVSRGGEVTVYDTADHQINGVSQQQGGHRGGLAFTSQHGEVPLANLKVVAP